ncbi:MAG TPA: hypothetical protein VGG14_11185 [Candidatus Sulfotelmatobacter sp.]
MKMKIDRIISIATLVASLVAIVLVLKKPAPVAKPQTPAAVTANAQSFSQKMDAFDQAAESKSPQANSGYHIVPDPEATASPQSAPAQTQTPDAAVSTSQPKAEVHLNSDEVSAVLAQALGGVGSGELNPDASLGTGTPDIKDQQVSFEGDTVHGQFLTEIAGKDVWVTVSGHLSSENGYATFEPTEFKIGDLQVPVSLVNPELQKRLLEQKDRLKLPDNVGGLKVDKGELVLQGK